MSERLRDLELLMSNWPTAPDDAALIWSFKEWNALRQAILGLQYHVKILNKVCGELELEKRILAQALRPFAIVADYEGKHDPDQPEMIRRLSIADYRDARTALTLAPTGYPDVRNTRGADLADAEDRSIGMTAKAIGEEP